MKFRVLYVLLFMVSLVPLRVRAQAPRVTLAQAVAAARQNPPRVRQALASFAVSERALREAKGAYFPSLTVSANAGLGYDKSPLTDTLRYDQTNAAYGASANLDVPIFDMSRGHRIGAAEQSRKAAEEAARDVERQAVADVVQLYATALAADQLVTEGEVTDARRASQHEAIEGLVKAGLRPQVDAVRTEVEAVSAHYALGQWQTAARRAKAALAAALGLDPVVGVIAEPLDWPSLQEPDDLQEAVELAIGHRPDLRQLEATVRGKQREVQAARMRRLPTFGIRMVGSASNTHVLKQTEVPGLARREGPSYSASGLFVVQWNALDATVLRSLGTSEASLVEAQSQLDTALLRLRAEVVDASYGVEVAAREVERATRVLDGAQRALQAQSHRYEVGAASLLDLLDAEQLAQDARVDVVQSRRELTLARLALLTSLGTLQDGLQQ